MLSMWVIEILSFDGDVVNDAAWQEDGKEVYVDLNPHNNLFDRRIDTVRRTHDYYFPVRCNIVRRASFTIPAGYKVESLPASATFTTPEGTLSCSFTRKDNTTLIGTKSLSSSDGSAESCCAASEHRLNVSSRPRHFWCQTTLM